MKIKDIPKQNRPRERFLKYGPEVLSDAELFAIFLRTGTIGENVTEMSNRLMAEYGLDKLFECSLKELQEIKGMGPSKAMQILAMSELGKRVNQARKGISKKISCAEDVQGNIHFGVGGGSITGEAGGSLDEYHHVVATFDLDEMQLWIDGELKDSAPTANQQTNAADLYIARERLTGQDNYFAGTVDELIIWDRVLTDDEIVDLYNLDGVNSIADEDTAIFFFPENVLYSDFTVNDGTVTGECNGVSCSYQMNGTDCGGILEGTDNIPSECLDAIIGGSNVVSVIADEGASGSVVDIFLEAEIETTNC
jgi:hypothetical protein